jgi:hypothetical protein
MLSEKEHRIKFRWDEGQILRRIKTESTKKRILQCAHSGQCWRQWPPRWNKSPMIGRASNSRSRKEVINLWTDIWNGFNLPVDYKWNTAMWVWIKYVKGVRTNYRLVTSDVAFKYTEITRLWKHVYGGIGLKTGAHSQKRKTIIKWRLHVINHSQMRSLSKLTVNEKICLRFGIRCEFLLTWEFFNLHVSTFGP